MNQVVAGVGRSLQVEGPIGVGRQERHGHDRQPLAQGDGPHVGVRAVGETTEVDVVVGRGGGR